MSIQVSHLTKLYGEQKAIDNISFTIHKSEIVGFLGPNGAGKSTTMKILTGYLEADGGEASIAGIPVRGNAIESKRKIGYLPEANPLYPEMYVREYLAFIADVHNLKQLKRKRIEEVIAVTGLSPESNKKIGQLSKGYKQRVGLAAALVHEPEVLILDEPTSGLDPNQIVDIRQLITNLGRDKTVLFSSHILQEVQAICDRVIIINKGIIVADDTLNNLQSSKINSHAVIVQFNEPVSLILMQEIKNADLVEQDGDNNSEVAARNFKVHTSNPESVRKQLMELSLKHNLNIVSLQSETQSLEEVFRDLTG
ncbi:MAG: gliding motility-associated ABC transporter ATP-binding subunit GldA [Ginsengibacter sp.]